MTKSDSVYVLKNKKREKYIDRNTAKQNIKNLTINELYIYL
jgi:hypothetical protein